MLLTKWIRGEQTMSKTYRKVDWNVRKLAEERGLSFDDVVYECHIFRESLRPIWRGESVQVSVATIERLCTGLQATPGDLWKVTEGPMPEEKRAEYGKVYRRAADREADKEPVIAT